MQLSRHNLAKSRRKEVSTRDSDSIVRVRDISVGYKTEIHSRGSPRVREQDLLARISRGVAHHREETTARNEWRTRRRNGGRDGRILVVISWEMCVSLSFIVNRARFQRAWERPCVKSSMKMAITQWRSNVYFHSGTHHSENSATQNNMGLACTFVPVLSCRCTQNSPRSLLRFPIPPPAPLPALFFVHLLWHREVRECLLDLIPC